MSGFKEYDQYDGLGLADLIQKKEVSPQEVLDEAVSRIEEFNPTLNAVILPMFDYAHKLVKSEVPDGPFKGVPFLLKDLLAAFKGVPMTMGSRACRNYIPKEDSELVKRFKKAGLVIAGKTNTPEFGLLGVTEPELHGPTRNPWDPNRTPGGSSGGSASAIASGMVPLASAGDGGGSIRIPAACCGLFGLKPSRGRNPTGPTHGRIWQGAVVEHVITRSVRDSAAVLDATLGPDTGAPYFLPPPDLPYLEDMDNPPGKLKIAFNTQSPIGTEVHRECILAVEHTATLLESLGHHVEEARPELDGLALANSYVAMYFGEIAADLEEFESILGRKVKQSDVEDQTWTLGLLGRTMSSAYFVKSLREWDRVAREMGRFHEKYDLYLTPALASPPVKIGEMQLKPAERIAMKVVNTFGLGRLLKASGLIEKIAADSFAKVPFTQLSNFTGQPSMSVPLHWTEDNLPCGVQFTAPLGDEATLFRLAAQLEKETPWFDKRPPAIRR